MCKRWWSFEYSFSWIDSQVQAELEFVDVEGLKVSTSSSAGLNSKKEKKTKTKNFEINFETHVRDQITFILTRQRTLQAWHTKTQIMCNN